MVASVKPALGSLGSLPNGGITPLDELAWGHYFIASGQLSLSPGEGPNW